jgi:uncharacterized protein YkwD
MRHSCYLVSCLMLLAFASTSLAADQTSPKGELKPNDPARFLILVNQARSQPRTCGDKEFKAVPPLAWNSKLATAAKQHARDMASKNRMSHKGSDGSQVWDRAQRNGYNYKAIGENVAMNPFGIPATVEAWLNSPGHCANIMNQIFSELGAAADGEYSVLVFGNR